MENETKTLEKTNGKFQKVDGSILRMTLTFIYLYIIIQLFYIIVLLLSNSHRLLDSLTSFTLGNYLTLIIAPITLITAILLTFIIHKSFWKPFISFLAFIFIYFIYFLFSTGGKGETFGYGMIAFIYYLIWGSATLFLLGFAFRFLFNLKSKLLKISLSTLPFIIMGILIFITLFQTQNLTIDSCKKGSDSKQIACYHKLALEEQNYSICYIRKTNIDSCVWNVLKKINEKGILNSNLCSKNTNSFEADNCFRYLAIIKKDSSFCEKIQKVNGHALSRCYSDIARETGDSSLCENAIGATAVCYYNLAKINNDKSLCDKISVVRTGDNYWKNNCYSQFD